MSDKERTHSNEAVEKIIDNITSEMQNADGQYVPLGFTPPPAADTLTWSAMPNSYMNHYSLHEADMGYAHPFESQFGYMPHQPPQLFSPNIYLYQNGNTDAYEASYNSMQTHNMPYHHFPSDPISPQISSHTQLIENLVGNWMPTTSGTYSPFGTDPFNPTMDVFKTQPDNINGEPLEQPHEEIQFQFNRTTKKPRMVAEVKPMRPSYSDVLTKPVPQPKVSKVDTKEFKQKKDNNKKNSRIDKEKKVNSVINKIINTDVNAKDMSQEKVQVNKNVGDKVGKVAKTPQLTRKWASLDNISEPLNQTQKVDEVRKRKTEEVSSKTSKPVKKTPKSTEINDDSIHNKNEILNIVKNGVRKNASKANGRNGRNFEMNERPPGKRNQRIRRRETHLPFGVVGAKLNQYLKSWFKIIGVALLWLFNVISDVCSLSLQIGREMASSIWLWSRVHWSLLLTTSLALMQRIQVLTWIWHKIKGDHEDTFTSKDNNRFNTNGLQNNISMPTTGEEAMKRLLACKGKDPYSILGVTPSCTDEDIKRYYKRQAFLVHPDKNQQPGAEEAFKILVHAFDMIGEPDRRTSYDKGVLESVQVEQAWSELTELLAQLQQKVEAAANTIRCGACGLRHKRIKVERPIYASRNCATCKIYHATKEGDIWAESHYLGFLWHYYACMEGGVYDITDWAACQRDSLKHLKPDSHQVQYRIALGKQNGQPRRHSGSARTERPPDLENLLNTLYGQNETSGGTKRRAKKAK